MVSSSWSFWFLDKILKIIKLLTTTTAERVALVVRNPQETNRDPSTMSLDDLDVSYESVPNQNNFPPYAGLFPSNQSRAMTSSRSFMPSESISSK